MTSLSVLLVCQTSGLSLQQGPSHTGVQISTGEVIVYYLYLYLYYLYYYYLYYREISSHAGVQTYVYWR